MALVTYSESEGSDEEEQTKSVPGATAKTVPSSTSNFTVDKSAPNKIKVNLAQSREVSSNGAHEDEPVAKRPRIGAAAFSGFNSMLPAPKRDNLPAAHNGGNKPPARKIFSLKTGAEAAFSRESDAELRNLFAGQGDDNEGETRADTSIPAVLPKPTFAKPAAPATGGNAFLFKPLSVSRNQKKKKPTNGMAKGTTTAVIQPSSETSVTVPQSEEVVTQPAKKKISLFSTGSDATPVLPEPEEEEIVDDAFEPPSLYDQTDSFDPDFANQTHPDQTSASGPQSLDTIASDLNLSAAERRQLFGRNNTTSGSQALNIVNFNTDAEYAANQQLIAAGETIQHNPVRGIASGKHSLRQLVNTASAQKEALEESFAQGRRNKREAGNKYGW